MRALHEYLRLNPQDHPDCHPPGDLRAQASWLGSTLWAEELVEGRPSVNEVEVALTTTPPEEAPRGEEEDRDGAEKGVASRKGGVIQSEAEVFALARERFGLAS